MGLHQAHRSFGTTVNEVAPTCKPHEDASASLVRNTLQVAAQIFRLLQREAGTGLQARPHKGCGP